MIRVKRTGESAVTIDWEVGDDPGGWLAAAVDQGHLQDALAALADPMADGRPAATEGPGDMRVDEQLRSAVWLVAQLVHRIDVLTVALRGSGRSWRYLASLMWPEEPEPGRRRSAAQRRYDAARKRLGDG